MPTFQLLSGITGISEEEQQARRRSQAIIDKNQKLRSELDSMLNEHDVRTKQPDDPAAISNCDRRSNEQEKQMVCDFLPAFFSSFVNGHLAIFLSLYIMCNCVGYFCYNPFFDKNAVMIFMAWHLT
jgi:hypothetical protein